jgi:hypothetical protein
MQEENMMGEVSNVIMPLLVMGIPIIGAAVWTMATVKTQVQNLCRQMATLCDNIGRLNDRMDGFNKRMDHMERRCRAHREDGA